MKLRNGTLNHIYSVKFAIDNNSLSTVCSFCVLQAKSQEERDICSTACYAFNLGCVLINVVADYCFKTMLNFGFLVLCLHGLCHVFSLSCL